MKIHSLLWTLLIITSIGFSVPAAAADASPAENQAAQDNVKVNGVVRDAQGQAVPGASVYEQGTTVGTTTAQDGTFSLQLSSKNAFIAVSCLGYKDLATSAAGRSFIEVELEESYEMLDEVIAIGYGTIKKSSLTGSIAQVSGKDLASNPSVNLQDALQGRAAGVYVDPARQPGDGTTIRIRGVRSLNASNNPLLIVDGMPGSWENLNSNDVESMEIMKDAAATAIYGSRAANGVIMVTTKSARGSKKFNVELNSYAGFNNYRMVKLLDGPRYAEMIRDVKRYESYGTDYDKWVDSDIDTQEALKLWNQTWAENYYEKGIDFNWQNALLSKNSFTTGHTLSLGYNSEKLKYNLSYNFQNDNSYYKTVNYQRHILNSSVKFTPAKWIELTQTTRLSYRKNSGEPTDTYNSIARMTPFETPYVDDDKAQGLKTVVGKEGYVNPLWNYEKGHFVNNKLNLMADLIFGVTVRPTSWLSLQTNLKLNFAEYTNGKYFDSKSTEQNLGLNYGYLKKQSTAGYTWNAIVTADKTFGSHHLALTGVVEAIQDKMNYVSAESQDIAAAYMDYHFLQSGVQNRDLKSGYEKASLFSVLGRFQYDFRNKLIFNAAVRYDGSSRLAAGNKWRLFPSVSAAWRISEEPFIKNLGNKISDLKVRVSYGEIGNQAIDPYQTLTSLKSTTYSWGGEGVYAWYPSTLANQNLGWEVSKTVNAGIDFGFLGNRITGTVEYYHTNTQDVLMKRTIPDVTGFSYIWQNIGSTQNQGVEFSLNGVAISTRDLTWSIGANASRNWNKITGLIDGQDLVSNAWFIGQPINVIYDHKFDGIWQLDEAEQAKVFKAEPGQIKVKNLDDSDEAITDSDKTILGTKDPKWLASLHTSLTYKGFDLSLNFSGQFGYLISASNYVPKWNGEKWMSADVDWWTPLNPTNKWPRVQTSPDHNYASTLQYFRGDFIKLQNINLGYDFSRLIKSKVFSKLRLYAEGRNVAYLYKGCPKDVTPEEPNSVYTIPATYVLGINLTF